MKYWISILFEVSPAMFQRLFASTPTTQGWGWATATADGPSPHVDCDPTFADVEVGKLAAGPIPQVKSPGLPGDTQAVELISPRPKLPLPPASELGCQTNGKIVRVMRLQSRVKVIGTTGWILRTF